VYGGLKELLPVISCPGHVFQTLNIGVDLSKELLLKHPDQNIDRSSVFV
jgi:hypothetical protein